MLTRAGQCLARNWLLFLPPGFIRRRRRPLPAWRRRRALYPSQRREGRCLRGRCAASRALAEGEGRRRGGPQVRAWEASHWPGSRPRPRGGRRDAVRLHPPSRSSVVGSGRGIGESPGTPQNGGRVRSLCWCCRCWIWALPRLGGGRSPYQYHQQYDYCRLASSGGGGRVKWASYSC